MAYLWKSLMHFAQVAAEELLLPEQVAVHVAVPHTASFALRFVPLSEVLNVLLPSQKTVIEKDHADVLSGLPFLSKDPAHRHTQAKADSQENPSNTFPSTYDTASKPACLQEHPSASKIPLPHTAVLRALAVLVVLFLQQVRSARDRLERSQLPEKNQ